MHMVIVVVYIHFQVVFLVYLASGEDGEVGADRWRRGVMTFGSIFMIKNAIAIWSKTMSKINPQPNLNQNPYKS